ncbi:hypothetical protein UFOVP1454_34 [uncultured Caudovirales phage]|uniref:Uncharacterized protein n=1 Tax=uncultured Caudovirales phage TaxID=2100421 RepID=A0A6J5SJ54_9CAUD|nr:hypothetical protein UFOVP1454_34 [uncultured Caudovirales phage]
MLVFDNFEANDSADLLYQMETYYMYRPNAFLPSTEYMFHISDTGSEYEIPKRLVREFKEELENRVVYLRKEYERARIEGNIEGGW